MSLSSFLLEEKYNEIEDSYKYNLSSACTPALSLYNLIDSELDLNAMMKHKLDYSQQYGLFITREKIAQKIYKNSSSENLILTSGASEAIYLTMISLFKKGDKVIVQKPIYQSLYQILEDMGCDIIDWYGFDLNELKDLYSKEIKALIINNPNNPTGLAFKESELKEISQIIEEKMIIADEVFRCLNDDIPAITEIHENSISINDLSKSFSLPGLRLGWLQTNNKIYLEIISSQKNYISLRNSSLSELVASFALDQFEKIKTRNQKILSYNKQFFFENLASLPFEAIYKKEDIMGLTTLVKVKSKDLFKQAFKKDIFICDGLLLDKNLGLQTRIGFGLDPKDFKEALELL